MHNDIKENNIGIERLSKAFRLVLIDFGKACYLKDGRMYNLSIKEKNRYAKQYPQVAPEVRQGIALQSYESDMWADTFTCEQ